MNSFLKTKNSLKGYLRILGPGLITGAADDDPSGIATYSQTGAQFGYRQLWTALYMLPFMIAVQEACARIGLVTGKGLAAVVRDNYSKKMLTAVLLLVLTANIINIGADIGAMAEAARLIIPVPFSALAVTFAVITLILEVLTTYHTYARFLKWLAISLLAYPLTLFIIHQPWQQILKATVTPHLEFSFAFLFIITGVIGTTISPYMFFWEASQEVEETRARSIKDNLKPTESKRIITRMRLDNASGMVISEFATWSIIVVAATVLHQSGVTNLRSAADAARALEPLVHSFPHAGILARLIFAFGIIGLGLLAVPVLSGSAAYAVCEAFRWTSGLDMKWYRAKAFYTVICFATLIGLGINFVGIDPVKALVFAAVMNGISAVPLLLLIIRIGSNARIMGDFKNGRLSNALLWLTFLAMGGAAIALIYTLLK